MQTSSRKPLSIASLVCTCAILLVTFNLAVADSPSEQTTYDFGVVNQRSVALTAESWNPILNYVSQKTGLSLRLKIGKTAPETTAMTARGEHAFAYSNHMFSPERDRLGYRVVMRMAGEPIQGVIVVREDGPIHSLEQLQGQPVAFPSTEAFVSYKVIMDHLMRHGIKVKASTHGNQEAAMSQLQFGNVVAACVNIKILREYREREALTYRVLWATEPYLDMPIMANPNVPDEVVNKVVSSMVGMPGDPAGLSALMASANALGLKEHWSFLRANDLEYENYRQFYRNAIVDGNDVD